MLIIGNILPYIPRNFPNLTNEGDLFHFLLIKVEFTFSKLQMNGI